ncbi:MULTISPECIES: DUF3164 family protein [Rhizobium]|uniref:DUF3164 family protein n=1 Tax=Rhizobium TaxID=379 RepID=UPI001030B90C|nr:MULTISPECIES: DUF3164 family protein [Rhizobium]MBB4465471.1 hypothetical protein [Rhizobium leguminosarum]MBB4472133.1 hypothetical protein [Rhizobium leguminosarum]MBY5416924.1 DUF3164 family protein [Rhizobium leguminosarum]TAU06590.1 DUF3164 family protein [Rhizobium ruizarguesonis]TAZ41466.1 DUF3164 family protein [Rhizobium ruizarguesonis]
MDSVIIANGGAPGVIEVNGRLFMINAKGGYDPIAAVKEHYKLEDQTVRSIFGFAEDLSAQISRFKGHTASDLLALDTILAEKYGTKIGGKKGNRTYCTYDGLRRITVQVSDQITFGPELQIAKQLIDECMTEWSADSRPEIQSIVTRAFNTDKEGQVNRSEVFMLKKLDFKDERWQQAMEAISDAIRITGSKEYVRFHRRDRQQDEWQPVTIDMAKA